MGVIRLIWLDMGGELNNWWSLDSTLDWSGMFAGKQSDRAYKGSWLGVRVSTSVIVTCDHR